MRLNRIGLLIGMTVLVALLAAACGDDGLEHPEMPEFIENGPGIVIVDGRRQTVGATRLCGEREGLPRDFDFAATAGDVSIFVTINRFENDRLVYDLALLTNDGVSSNFASEIDEVWLDQFGNELSGPPFEIDNGQVRGAIAVVSGEQMADPIQVSFAIPIPEEESGPDECPAPVPMPGGS